MQGVRAQGATEDIEKVLGRFQAWTGSRASKSIGNGVRELSYEEALESSRWRWKDRAEPPSSAQPKDELQPEPGVVPIPSPEPAPYKEAAAPLECVNIAPESLEAPRTAISRVRKAPRRRQQFSTILAQSTGFSGSGLTRAWGSEERQVSMSLRVATSEQALIKTRAAEAGVSASAYLRQCALEVEILRAQVQQFMAMSGRTRMKELRNGTGEEMTAATGPSDGWLSRWRRRLLGKVQA